MISAIALRNFQRHKQAVFYLGRITSIIGDTDTGKSAIIRAFRWAALNSRGNYMRNDEKRCAVEIRLSNGTRVKRVRAGSESSYTINKQTFKALGAAIPDQLKAALNMNELNFQGQHDAAFWFSATPGEVSRHLNQIVNLGEIDSVLARVAARLRKTKDTAAIRDDFYQESKAKIEAFEWVEAFDSDLKKVEAAQEQFSQIVKDVDSLESQLGEASQLLAHIESEVPDFTKADKIYEQLQLAQSIHLALYELTEALVASEECTDLAKYEAQEAKNVLVERTNGICPICGGKL